MRKVLLVVALLLVLGAGFVVWGYFHVSGSAPPRRDGQLAVAGLSGPVSVRFDRWAVPHVTAEDPLDLSAAVGFLHANDRMTQLELARRSCRGRLAEAIGESALPLDERHRHLRLAEGAERLWQSAGDDTRGHLEAYARGVNAWLAAQDGELPPALALLGVEAAPWTPQDSLCMVMLMGRDLSFPGGFPEEARYTLLASIDRQRAFELLDIDRLDLPPEALPEPPARRSAALAPLGVPPAARRPSDEGLPPGGLALGERPAVGSNNWAVGAGRSATGAPLVANDPHLGLTLPSTWYQVMLRAPGLEIHGFTLPGVPMVVVGQTAQLAWSVTNTQLDDHDLFIEQLDESGERVRRGDGWQELTVSREEIPLRGGGSREIVLKRSDRGPLLPADEAAGLPPRSLAWTAYRATDPLAAFFGLARATSVDQVPEAVAPYAAPAQNLVVADREGGLLFVVLGWVPERLRGDGRLPAPGWDPSYGWSGMRPAADNPRVLRPEDDLLVTANNDMLPDGYELPFHADFASGERARRIRDLLVAGDPGGDGWGPAEMAAMQQDTHSLYAHEVLRLITEGTYTDDAARAYEALAQWDGAMDATGAGALFTLLERELWVQIFSDEGRMVGRRLGDRRRLLGVLSGEMDAAWYDDIATPEVEGRNEQLQEALERAWRQGRGRWGERVEAWNYGILHPMVLRHPMGALPVIGGWFNRGPVPVPGSPTSINAFAGIWGRNEQQKTVGFGPSMRIVADLADPDRSLAMLLPGQSGHPKDPHYDDQLAGFVAGEMRPMAWSEEAIAAATVSTVTLTPAPATP